MGTGLLAAALAAGPAVAGCEDPIPTNCPPPPSCQGCDVTRSTVDERPGRNQDSARGLGRWAWLFILLKSLAGGSRAF